MARIKKKGLSGEAAKYITRSRACRLLQLPLDQFRRLCILKGIYPREPKSRKKAQKGDTTIRTLYLKRDIAYLMHEPIIWKIREEKIYKRKLKKLTVEKDKKDADQFRKRGKPKYKFDHIILERYPDFNKALQDLDDPLSTSFLYSSMPKFRNMDPKLVHMSRTLTTEFMNYVIEARALRKAFISFKGYYYRAHINGHKVTWMIPHSFPTEEKSAKGVDLKVIKIFMEFYCTMLGFVNYKLYQSLNLHYPPKFPSSKHNLYVKGINVVECLSLPLAREFIDTEKEDEYDPQLLDLKNDKNMKLAQEELYRVKQQIQLFEGVKFYLGREINRESLTLVIRSCGGLVSWDSTVGPGSTYPEDDSSIKYQIVDRPTVDKKYLSRYYIQPQWVYDSFNASILLPVQNYFVGAQLPAHLSPFEEAVGSLYTPPEMERINALQKNLKIIGDNDENDDHMESDEEEAEEENVEEVEEEVPARRNKWNKDPLARMEVIASKPLIRDTVAEKSKQLEEDFELASTMVRRRHKRIFTKILTKEAQQKDKMELMKRKRILYEKQKRKQKKVK